jgi:hypothetical protein
MVRILNKGIGTVKKNSLTDVTYDDKMIELDRTRGRIASRLMSSGARPAMKDHVPRSAAPKEMLCATKSIERVRNRLRMS